MRRALIIGIDNYPEAPLAGCVNDALAVRELLACNADGSSNFQCRILQDPVDATPGVHKQRVTKAILREHITRLFADEADVALFYFSGHGTINNLGGFLVTPDATCYDEGIPMTAVLTLANQSKTREVVIILDCCHSGSLGELPAINNTGANLREGVSILTGSRASQVTVEFNGSGLFTSLICDALRGGAADVIGNVTVASMYTYVDQVLGAWCQRPLFKAHVSKLLPLRKCAPQVDLTVLRLLPKYFPTPETEFPLDPSFEPDSEPEHLEHEEIFGHLQKYRAARLLIPIGEEHMYYAAMNSKSCKLTELGAFYWRLANGGQL